MKKKLIIFGVVAFLLAGVGIIYTKSKNNNKEEYQETGMKVVLSLEDNITNDSVWCGTFNLIWNDLKNDLVKQDIVFNPQSEIVKNLNKGSFTTDYLSEKSYYKIYGFPNLELKDKIEKAIKEKFNEKSAILDDFEWENHREKDYFLYAMLKKEFKFNKMFTELATSSFGDSDNVEFFGIDASTNGEVRSQVQVLYYNNENNFAIKLLTKEKEEVIIAKGLDGKSFKEAYANITKKSEEYKGSKIFGKDDILKIPNISFKLKKEFEELQNKDFEFANGDIYYIQKAIQTIEFDLDKEGGKVKSEAGAAVNFKGLSPVDVRNFIVDDTFVIFLQEEGKTLPYFASKITDISNVQKS